MGKDNGKSEEQLVYYTGISELPASSWDGWS